MIGVLALINFEFEVFIEPFHKDREIFGVITITVPILIDLKNSELVWMGEVLDEIHLIHGEGGDVFLDRTELKVFIGFAHKNLAL